MTKKIERCVWFSILFSTCISANNGSSTTQLIRVIKSQNNLDLSKLNLNPSNDIKVVIASGVVIGSSSSFLPALTTGKLNNTIVPYKITLKNYGLILGAGGTGGSGGNGGSGGAPTFCGRNGLDGGTAIELTVPITVLNHGKIFGGGGGGGGGSGCNVNTGGGGGMGIVAGPGGAKSTSFSKYYELAYCGQDNGYRTGIAGKAGTASAGGAGGRTGSGSNLQTAGAGGLWGYPGKRATGCGAENTSRGGAAGYSINTNGLPLSGVASGSYQTTIGGIRGPVGTSGPKLASLKLETECFNLLTGVTSLATNFSCGGAAGQLKAKTNSLLIEVDESLKGPYVGVGSNRMGGISASHNFFAFGAPEWRSMDNMSYWNWGEDGVRIDKKISKNDVLLIVFNTSRVFKVGNVKSTLEAISFMYEEFNLPELAPGNVKYFSLAYGEYFDFYTGLVRGFDGAGYGGRYGGQLSSDPFIPLVEVSSPVLLGETHSDQEDSITLNYLDTADNNALATAVFSSLDDQSPYLPDPGSIFFLRFPNGRVFKVARLKPQLYKPFNWAYDEILFPKK